MIIEPQEINSFKIDKPEHWAHTLTDQEVIARLKETDFSREQTDEGRDYCFFLDKIRYVSDEQNNEYVFVAYTLNDPVNLESASAKDIVIEENEEYIIHRISVLRDGVLIDKIPDTKIRVLDSEDQSHGGVINSTKKINISIKDLRLYDIILLEDSRIKSFTDRDFLRKKFKKYVWISPENYWAYGNFNFTFKNNCETKIAYKSLFFRDENNVVLQPEINYLEKGEQFVLNKKDYINFTDSDREISPYIDFATDASWRQLTNYFYPFYEEAYNAQKLEDFAPKLVEKLNAISDKDLQLQFAIEYVQNNVNYIFNNDEMSGHKPQEPALTYKNKQGDCKAKSVLLKVVLDYINVEASVVLVNFNSGVHLKYYLPSILSFNHVIVKIEYKGNSYFVDATCRDEYGLLENRTFYCFRYYLEIKPNQPLQEKPAHKSPYFSIDEKIDFRVNKNTGQLSISTKYKGNRANSMRRYYKSTSKREIIDSWNKLMYFTLNYCNDRNGVDPRNIFKDATIEILFDDKLLNEITFFYKTTIENPYFTDSNGDRFLMYFDNCVNKTSVKEYIHNDILFFNNFESEKYEINLMTDQKIDTQEKFTKQECAIKNPYFDYTCTKKIHKNGGTALLTFEPLINLDVKAADFEEFRLAHQKVSASHNGLGIDIIEEGVLNQLKFGFKKMFS